MAILGPDDLGADDRERLGVLHVQSLPETAIAYLGPRYAASFYRYINRSPSEHIFVHRDGPHIDSAAILSLAPESIARRLWIRTPLLVYLGALVSSPKMLGVMKALPPWNSRQGRPRTPELISIFTAPHHRRRGLAIDLLARSERFLLASGYDCYVLRTSGGENNQAAQFYAHAGLVRSAPPEPEAAGVQTWEKTLAQASGRAS